MFLPFVLALSLSPSPAPGPKGPPEPAPAVKADDDNYVITDKTEVLLDGAPCRYQDVDKGKADIVTMEVDRETKRVTKLCFRTKAKE